MKNQKKHELLKHAYDNYPAGVIARFKGIPVDHVSSGKFQISERQGSIYVMCDKDQNCFYSSDCCNGEPEWAKPIIQNIEIFAEGSKQKLAKLIVNDDFQAVKEATELPFLKICYDKLKEENNTLQLENNKLMGELARCKRNEEGAEIQLQTWIDENHRLMNQIASSKSNSKLKQENDELLRVHEEHKRTMKGMAKQNEELKTANQAWCDQNAEVHEQLNGVVEDNGKLQKALRNALKDNECLEKTTHCLDNDKRELNTEVKHLKIKIDQCQKDLYFAREQTKSVMAENNRLDDLYVKPGIILAVGGKKEDKEDGTYLSEDEHNLLKGDKVYSVVFNPIQGKWCRIREAWDYSAGFIRSDEHKLFRYSEFADRWVKKANNRMEGIIVVELENNEFAFKKDSVYVPGLESYLNNEQFQQLIDAYVEVNGRNEKKEYSKILSEDNEPVFIGDTIYPVVLWPDDNDWRLLSAIEFKPGHVLSRNEKLFKSLEKAEKWVALQRKGDLL